MKIKFRTLTLAMAGMLMLWSCSSENEEPNPKPQPVDPTNLTVTEENNVVKEGDVTVELPLSAIGESAELSIAKTVSATPVLGCDEKSVILDISMGDVHDVDGIIEIKMPYTPSKSTNQVGAGYFNEDTQEWEPVDWEYKNGIVTIFTDHLSTYGIFDIKYENTASANFIATCDTYNFLFGNPLKPDEKRPFQAFVSLSQSDGEAAQVIDVLSETYGTANQFLNDFGYNSVKALGFDTFADGFMDAYGDHISILGGLFTTWQVARQVHEGKNKEAFASIVEAVTTNTISIMGGFFGSSFSVVGLAAYLASKYVVNSFFEGVITARKDVWVQAYELYQKQHPRYYKDWYKLIYPIVTNQNTEDWEKEEAIDKLVHDYCYEFWKDYDVVLEYYYEITKQSSGAGMNEDSPMYKEMMKEISENRRGQLYNNVIPGVITEINGKLREKNFKTYKTRLLKYQGMMNQKFTFRIVDDEAKDGKSNLKGYKVKFAELPKDIKDPDKWECTLDKAGCGTIELTLFAYIKNKMKPKMVLVDKDDKEVKELSFVPSPFETTVHIKAEAPVDVVGEWTFQEWKDSRTRYSFLYGDHNTSVRTLKFNEDGTYLEHWYSGMCDENNQKFSYTPWAATVRSYGIYSVDGDLLTMECQATDGFAGESWDGNEDKEFTIQSSEEVSNITIGKISHPSYEGVKMVIKSENHSADVLYKNVWQMQEVPVSLPTWSDIRISCSCATKETCDNSGTKTENENYRSVDYTFKNEFVKMTQNGKKYHIVAAEEKDGESYELIFDVETLRDNDGKENYQVSNLSFDGYKSKVSSSSGATTTTKYLWKAEQVPFILSTGYEETYMLFEGKQDQNIKLTCDYHYEYVSKNYYDIQDGKLNPEKEYDIKVYFNCYK